MQLLFFFYYNIISTMNIPEAINLCKNSNPNYKQNHVVTKRISKTKFDEHKCTHCYTKGAIDSFGVLCQFIHSTWSRNFTNRKKIWNFVKKSS